MNQTKGIQQRVGKPFFSSLCSRAAGVDDRHRGACRATAGPLPLFFFFSFHHQTLLSWSPLKSPADTPSSCPRARQADGSKKKKKKQLCSWSTATKKATKTRGKKKQTSHTAQYTTTWICTFNSWLWQHIMPKPDFTSRPERMSSCFPHTHTDCDGGGKLWAGWQQTPP